jgi:hypothetical protein
MPDQNVQIHHFVINCYRCVKLKNNFYNFIQRKKTNPTILIITFDQQLKVY